MVHPDKIVELLVLIETNGIELINYEDQRLHRAKPSTPDAHEPQVQAGQPLDHLSPQG